MPQSPSARHPHARTPTPHWKICKDFDAKVIVKMSKSFQQTLDELNADYIRVKGQPPSHFFCPILFRDEDTELCEAHIINQALPDAPTDWTVQRKDVDNFYGAYFESEFIAIQYNSFTHDNIFTDKRLSKLFKPQILVDDRPIDYFVAGDEVPQKYTRLVFENDGQTTQLGLKISPEDFLKAKESKWEMSISKDVRVSALISLIKAAHLTFFKMLGYKYAFSAGGHFVGRHILGEFFLQNKGKTKKEILENAYSFFKEFAHTARPISSSEVNFQGSISDNQILLCQKYGDIAWGCIVFVKTAQTVNAVLLPYFDQPDSVIRYFDFLKNDKEEIDVALMRFEQGHFELTRATKIIWPKNGILYPDELPTK